MALAVALGGATPVSAAWMEARTAHFVVYEDGSEAEVRDMATRLERFDRVIRYVQKTPPEDPATQANPLTVYVVSGVAEVQRLYGKSENIAGFYNNNFTGNTAAFTPKRSGNGGEFDLNAGTVLFHEYAHHFMFRNFSALYPRWFVEGFAEFYSTANFEKNGDISLGRPPMYRAYGLLKLNKLPLTVLLDDNRKFSPEQQDVFYGRSWLLTHYLTFDEPRRGQLTAYLKAINEGKPSLEAAQSAFGDLRVLEKELDAYLNRRSMKALFLKAIDTSVGSVVIRQLDPGEAALMPARLRSRRGVSDKTAPAVLADARRLAAPYADDPRAQDALAEAEYDAGNDDLAEAAADRALKADPKDRVAMLYKGQVAMRRAMKARTTASAAWTEARRWLIKANRLEPNDPLALELYYRSFLAQGIQPKPDAIAGLTRAFELAPEVGELRWMLARQTLIGGDAKAARLLLAPLAFDPHAAPDSLPARIIAMIDANDIAGARTALGQPDKAAP